MFPPKFNLLRIEFQFHTMHTHSAPFAKPAARAFTLLSVALFFIASAAGAEEIIWIKRHFPPAFILEGDLAGQGVHDMTVDLVQRGLAEYTHRIILANHPRTKRLMESGPSVCRAGLYRNSAREKAMYMSIAHILVPPHRIFIKKTLMPEIRPLLEKEGVNRISLEKLILSRPDLTLGIEAGRSYGRANDKVLKPLRDRPNITARYESHSEGYVKMLLAGRTDYIIELPPILLFVLRHEKAALESLCSLEIAESRVFQPASIGCSKTPAGKAIIDRINVVLQKERTTDAFRGNIERWLDENTIPAFRQAYETVFLADTPGPQPNRNGSSEGKK